VMSNRTSMTTSETAAKKTFETPTRDTVLSAGGEAGEGRRGGNNDKTLRVRVYEPVHHKTPGLAATHARTHTVHLVTFQ